MFLLKRKSWHQLEVAGKAHAYEGFDRTRTYSDKLQKKEVSTTLLLEMVGSYNHLSNPCNYGLDLALAWTMTVAPGKYLAPELFC